MNPHQKHFLTFLAFCMLLLSDTFARAALVVSNLNDGGVGSLRNAIAESASGESIVFATNLSGTIRLTKGELVINKDLTIHGPGAAALTVSAETNSRVMGVISGAVTISGLTLANGVNWQTHGGGIANHGVLTLSNCIVRNNLTADSFVTVSGAGGGIWNSGDLTVVGSTLLDNGATTGGGLFNGGTAVLRNSTVSGNVTGSGLVIIGPGGGIANFGDLLVEHCTISSNFSHVHSGGGGGIYNVAGTATIGASIVAGNDNYLSDSPDVAGVFVSSGFNVIGTTTGASGFTNGVNHDRAGNAGARLNPRLGPLQDNGGPTPTHALLQGSPAIDAGNSPDGAMDQRGQPRRANFLVYADAADGSDVGAFELQESMQSGSTLVVNTLDDVDDGLAGIAHCSLREAITAANTSSSTATIVFESGLSDVVSPLTGVIVLTNGQLHVTRSLQLLGSTHRIVIEGNGSSRLFQIAAASPGLVVISNLTLVRGNAGGANGGAILNGAGLALTRCTLATNQAASGGAIFCSPGAALLLDHCTLSANTAAVRGGALGNDGGTNYLKHCTVISNIAANGGGVDNPNGVVTLRNTVIGGNRASVVGSDGAGTLHSDDFNLLGSSTGFTLTGQTTHTLIGLNPLLGPLADNGGPTPTHLPLTNSPLIDAGSTDGELVDQRGVRRLANMTGETDAGDGGDIGAVEFDIQLESPVFVVNTLDDVDDGMATIGHCSLREAIHAANAAGGTSTIGFASHVTGAIHLTEPLPSVAADISIEGPGPEVLTVRRNSGGEYGILVISGNAKARITGVTISEAFFAESAGVGGGVRNEGTLLIQNCIIRDHRAYYGPGIFNSGTLTVLDSLISGNYCIHDGEGGGLYNADSGSVTLSNSVVQGNAAGNDLSFGGGIYNAGGVLRIIGGAIEANSALGEGAGGGIYNRSGGLVELDDATVSSNAAFAGGGVLNEGGSVTARRCTFSYNAAPEDDGGGIWNNGTLLLMNCTVYGNSSDFTGGGLFAAGTVTIKSCTIVGNLAYDGGGIMGTATLQNTLLAGNGTHTTIGHGQDCWGTIISQDFNLIQSTKDCTIIGSAAHNILGLDPKVGSLTNQCGPTLTCALLPGSPAIDRGHQSDLPTDQCGRPRMMDNPDFSNAPGGDASDIGACEADTSVNDEMLDSWEMQHFNTIALGPIDDPDHDGADNTHEFVAGTDPTDASSLFRITSIKSAGATIKVRFTTVAGRNYELQTSPALWPASWTSVGSSVPGTGAEIEVVDPAPATPQVGFYRALIQPH